MGDLQDPKMEVPTIYKAYVSEYHRKIWPYMIQYPEMGIPGSNRRRYVSTIFLAIFWGYIP
jgi:hypothetical protein